MRALLIVVIAILVLGGGYFLLTRGSGGTPATSTAMFATDTPTAAAAHAPPSHGADACQAQNATYLLHSDPRVHIRFETDGPPPRPHTNGVVGGLIDTGPAQVVPLIFVVEVPSKAAAYRFKASQTTTGWQRFLLQPIGGAHAAPAEGIEVDVFDANYKPLSGLPQYAGNSPEHIFSPDLSRWIYNLGADRRVDSPIGFFDFDQCVAPAAAH
jgi:hypothetical protein